MTKRLLWLDDERNPFEEGWLIMYAPEYRKEEREVVWVRTFNEFKAFIERNGVPDMIAFDHDLADAHYAGKPTEEKTGYDACKWLVNFCIENDVKFPDYVVQSANPIGKDNIEKYIENAKKHNNI